MTNYLVLFVLAFYLFSPSLRAQVTGSADTATECATKDISIRGNGKRKQTAFPSTLGVRPGQEVLSACLSFKGIDGYFIIESSDAQVSINNGPFELAAGQKLRDGDTLQLKVVAPKNPGKRDRVKLHLKEASHADELKRSVYLLIWQLIAVKDTGNTVFYVGPSHEAREIKEVLPRLRPGDTIVLEKDVVYQSFVAKSISGANAAPITLTSNATTASSRPRIQGEGGGRRDWVVGLSNSHYWHLDNVILENGEVCLRNEATHTLVSRVLINNCHHGVLGTDNNSGTITIENSEVKNSGGKIEGRAWGHALYIATDRDRFPGSTFTLRNSFVHSNRGNAVKSRAQNTHIINNWIETSSHEQSRYLLELIGYDAYDDSEPLYGLVEDNILVHVGNNHSVRVGGDGTGRNIGKERFSNNLFAFSSTFSGTVFRVYHGLGRLEAENNLFLLPDTNAILIRDMLTADQWTNGKPSVYFKNNQVSKVGTLYFQGEADADLSGEYFSDVLLQDETIDTVKIDMSDSEWFVNLNKMMHKYKWHSLKSFSKRPEPDTYILATD